MSLKTLDDDQLLRSDEVLRSLTHRAAYRTLKTLPFLLLPIVGVLTQFVEDSHWQAAGYAIIATFFLTFLIFEVIMAYDGVYKGLDELRANVSKRRAYLKAARDGFVTAVLMFLFEYYTMDDQSIVGATIQALVFGVFMASITLYRWRRSLESKKAR